MLPRSLTFMFFKILVVAFDHLKLQ
uniref:Uncharacterized protein n=1 Tax=Rhizophora mucronata TaxID=61149 RepID=A0A2P2PXF8_RHIMU